MGEKNIIEARDLCMHFKVTKGLFNKEVGEVKAVDHINLAVREGETLGIVGESGCGKTTFGRTLLRLYKPSSGQVIFDGKDITNAGEKELRKLHADMTCVFQDPFNSLDPRKTVGSIVGEPLKIHKLVRSKEEYHARVDELFTLVGLSVEMENRYPHEFSGGQRQRVAIARSLASNPRFLVCDEAISALDVSIQAQIINLLIDIKEKTGITYLFISHDLSVVKHISDRIAVLYLGRVVELSEAEELYDRPLHPYTKALLTAVPIPDPFVEEQRQVIFIEGEAPSPQNPPSGCHFHPRCPFADERCKNEVPQLREISSGHCVACHHTEHLNEMMRQLNQ